MKYIEFKHWDFMEVRQLCIKHDWYTCGDCSDYNNMLLFVSDNEATTENIARVARDIYEHSDTSDETITNIMCYLANDTVTTSYTEADS